MSNIRKFNVENCDIRTQLMFEDWATIPCLKVLTLILARKGKRVFSAKGIGEMLGLPKSTTIHALKLLIDNQYILKDGNNYFQNSGIYISGDAQEVDQYISQPTNPLVEVDQPIGQEPTNPLVTNNDKEIMIKNRGEIPAHLSKPKDPETDPLKKRSELIWLTDSQVESLIKKFKSTDEYKYWVIELTATFKNQPKLYKKYSNHSLTIQNWRKLKHEKGLKFAKHPDQGWGYYKPWDIKNFQEAA